MLTHTGTAMPRNPTRNRTALAIHWVVSTLRNPSWSNHNTSAYSPANMKNKITSPAMIAAVMASGARLRRGAFPADDVVTNWPLALIDRGSDPHSMQASSGQTPSSLRAHPEAALLSAGRAGWQVAGVGSGADGIQCGQ